MKVRSHARAVSRSLRPLLTNKASIEEFAVGWHGFGAPTCDQILKFAP
jgi:hypothetical protein